MRSESVEWLQMHIGKQFIYLLENMLTTFGLARYDMEAADPSMAENIDLSAQEPAVCLRSQALAKVPTAIEQFHAQLHIH